MLYCEAMKFTKHLIPAWVHDDVQYWKLQKSFGQYQKIIYVWDLAIEVS